MSDPTPDQPLTGRVALVATRGAGRAIAVEPARAGPFVYATGRSSKVTGPRTWIVPRTLAIAALASDPDLARYAGKVLSSAELARTYGVTDTDGTQPDCWPYLVEIQEKNRPATELGYR